MGVLLLTYAKWGKNMKYIDSWIFPIPRPVERRISTQTILEMYHVANTW